MKLTYLDLNVDIKEYTPLLHKDRPTDEVISMKCALNSHLTKAKSRGHTHKANLISQHIGLIQSELQKRGQA